MAILSNLEITLSVNSAAFTQSMTAVRTQAASTFDSMKNYASAAMPMIAKASTTIAVQTTAASMAVGVLVAKQMELVEQLERTARLAGTTSVAIQKYTYAAKTMGIEQDKLGDIFKDVQDKVGDFLTTGAGGMVDFFETVAPRIGVTADEFRKLSGPDALQLYYDSLEKANISQSEMIFHLEAIASDASLLIPLLANGGEGFRFWEEAARNAGAEMDANTIRATKELNASTQLLNLSWQGAKNQFTQAIIPVLRDVTGELVSNGNAAEYARVAGEKFTVVMKGLAVAGLGVYTVFQSVGKAIAGVVASFTTFFRGLDFSNPISLMMSLGKANLDAAHTFDMMVQDVSVSWSSLGANAQKIMALGTGTTNAQIAKVVELTDARNNYNKSLDQTGQQYQAQKKAAEEAAKASKKAAEAQKSYITEQEQKAWQRVLQNAIKYDFAGLEKRYALPDGLLVAVHMQESHGNAKAVGPMTKYGTAKGGFQFIDATWKDYGKGSVFDLNNAAPAAAKYLRDLINQFGDVNKAIAAYNAGPGNVKKYNGIPPFKETRGYVKGVNRYMGAYNGGTIQNYSPKNVINDAVAAQKFTEELIKKQHEFASQFLSPYEKLMAQIESEKANFESLGFEGDEYQRYKALLDKKHQLNKEGLENEKSWKMNELFDFQKTQEQLIIDKYQKERERLELNFEMHLKGNEELYKQSKQSIDLREQKELAEFRLTQDKKYASMYDFNRSEIDLIRQKYEFERREIELSNDARKDDLLLENEARKQYEILQLQKSHRDNALDIFVDIMGVSDYRQIEQDFELRKQAIDKALQNEAISYQEHHEMLYQIELQALDARNQLTTEKMQGIAGSMSSIMASITGENSKAYRAMFAIEKGFAIAKSVMAIQTAIASGGASLPFPANLTAMATIASNMAGIIATIKSVTMPIGQAHDGIMSVPKSGTWNLEKGERVLPKHTAQNLDNTLNRLQGGGQVINVNVTVNSDGGDVQASHEMGKNLGNAIKLAVQAELQKERRQGGLLYGR